MFGLARVDDLKEKLAFILVCLGLSLSQLLGQNSPSPDKDKLDQPGKLLANILTASPLDQTERRRLNRTFAEFLSYYDSVRHFGENRDEKNYQTVDRLTIQELDRFRRMALEVWDVVIDKYRDDDQHNLAELRSITELVPFRALFGQPDGSNVG